MFVTPVTINSVQENTISFFYLFAVFEILHRGVKIGENAN